MNASTGIKVVYAKSSSRWMDRVTQVNRELWLVLSLFVIAGLLNWRTEPADGHHCAAVSECSRPGGRRAPGFDHRSQTGHFGGGGTEYP